MAFNEKDWLALVKKADSMQEIKALMDQIPDDYIAPDSLLASITAQQTTSSLDLLQPTPTEKTLDGSGEGST